MNESTIWDFLVFIWAACLLLVVGLAPFVMLALIIRLIV